jgi:hypothetical protein
MKKEKEEKIVATAGNVIIEEKRRGECFLLFIVGFLTVDSSKKLSI